MKSWISCLCCTSSTNLSQCLHIGATPLLFRMGPLDSILAARTRVSIGSLGGFRSHLPHTNVRQTTKPNPPTGRPLRFQREWADTYRHHANRRAQALSCLVSCFGWGGQLGIAPCGFFLAHPLNYLHANPLVVGVVQLPHFLHPQARLLCLRGGLRFRLLWEPSFA